MHASQALEEVVASQLLLLQGMQAQFCERAGVWALFPMQAGHAGVQACGAHRCANVRAFGWGICIRTHGPFPMRLAPRVFSPTFVFHLFSFDFKFLISFLE